MISVIIATKNGSTYLPRAIKSIQNQSEKDLEIIVVSDASTDNTVQIATDLSVQDPRISIISLSENIGPGRARDVGIKKANGDLIAIIDDDDIWLSNEKLRVQKEYLKNNPECVLVGSGDVEFVRENGEQIFTFTPPSKDKHIRDTILLQNAFITSSVLFRKKSYEQVGGFSSLYLAEDYDLWMKLGLVGTFANIEGSSVRTQYTIRNGGLSHSRKIEMAKVVLSLVKKYKSKYPNFLYALIKAYARILITSIK